MTRAEMTQAVMPRAERSAGPLLLGVRHHGPGSARAVRAALDAARPQAVLVEGPPEADALLPLAADERMRPPVALLAHAVDDPGQAAFWPLAAFSPEWIAIRWALEHGVPVRFIDLPAANSLAMTQENGNGEGDEDRDGGSEEDGERTVRRGRRARSRGPRSTPSACSPGRRATTTRSAGGRTSSNTAPGTARPSTRGHRSPPSPRR